MLKKRLDSTKKRLPDFEKSLHYFIIPGKFAQQSMRDDPPTTFA